MKKNQLIEIIENNEIEIKKLEKIIHLLNFQINDNVSTINKLEILIKIFGDFCDVDFIENGNKDLSSRNYFIKLNGNCDIKETNEISQKEYDFLKLL
jgi:hypothetical protein